VGRSGSTLLAATHHGEANQIAAEEHKRGRLWHLRFQLVQVDLVAHACRVEIANLSRDHIEIGLSRG
jgi:hypothetical protein